MPPVTPDQVKQRYRMLAMRHHPDRGGDAAAFVLVNDAYREALSLARPRG
jgi:curved DNA-binding protein CbpA